MEKKMCNCVKTRTEAFPIAMVIFTSLKRKGKGFLKIMNTTSDEKTFNRTF